MADTLEMPLHDHSGAVQPESKLTRTGRVILGRTLPSLLDEACERNPIEAAFNQRLRGEWVSWSTEHFRRQAEEVALGLLELDLVRGDRVALLMESDVTFGIVDMACLVAGLVNVPVYLTHASSNIHFCIKHTEARALVISGLKALENLPPLNALHHLQVLILAGPIAKLKKRLKCPAGLEVLELEEIRRAGTRRLEVEPRAADELKNEIHPHDLATIVYTSGTTGVPKGVMLTHENISFNVLASFTGFVDQHRGEEEVAASFLPLTHAFARMMHYGYMNYGFAVYFTTPDELAEDLKFIRPTIFAAVPRVLEKFYEGLRQAESRASLPTRFLVRWGVGVARNYRLGEDPTFPQRLQLAVADRVIFQRWRDALGGRLRFVIAGGAAVRPEITNIFAAAGIQILQGYGLTETSPVISYNRPEANRAGTVGVPLVGVEVAVASDGEILTRGPHVMKGYYRNPAATKEAIDENGWFHTGDIGKFSPEGALIITDRKKDLFKLSTGKYVMPQPLQNRLESSLLVEHAVVVGEGRKFCAALIFPEFTNLRNYARRKGIDDLPLEELVRHPIVLGHFQSLVDESNQEMPPWATIKKFAVIPVRLSIENGHLTPTLKPRRRKINEEFRREIDRLYNEEDWAEGSSDRQDRSLRNPSEVSTTGR
ncbi:MAG TPA: AMP-dependent synthetase/ligase [Acidobacteriota bacterium]|nr:AMP-dependent synthetase/ligase [Acidobacteriota bacterium]